MVGPPKLTLRKRHVFVMEKYIEDVRKYEKHVLDLLESIMRPADPVKEELRRFSTKIEQFGPKSKKSGFQFLDSGNPEFSRRRPMPAFSPVGFKQKPTLPDAINPNNGTQNLHKSRKCGL